MSDAQRFSHKLQPYAAEMKAAMMAEKEQYWREFEDMVAGNAALFDSLFDVLDGAHKAQLIATLWRNMRHWGCSSYDILRGIKVIVTEGRGEMPVILRIVKAFATPGPRITKVLPYLNRAGVFAAVISAAIASAIAIRRGAYHLVAVETYKLGLSLTLPWAGLVDAMQELLSTVWPAASTNPVFKYLGVLNPVAMGGITVDMAGTLISCWLAKKGDVRRLEELIGRMKEAGASAPIEMGEKLGDVFFKLAQMNETEFRQAVKTSAFRR